MSDVNRQPEFDFVSFSAVALQLIEDVEQIYGQSVQQLATQENDFRVNDSSVSFGEIKKGELVVISTRDKLLGDDFKCRIVSHVACELGQSVTVFSTSDSFIMFSRKLIGYLSQITEDKDIYSGKLNDAELRRLSSVLTVLSTVKLGMYPFTYIPIDELCKRSIMHFQQSSDAGLIFVDTVKNISDYDPRIYPQPVKRQMGIQSRLIRLKELAIELMVPIVVIHQLELRSHHSWALTQFELEEIVELSEVADGVMFISGSREKLVCTLPKIINAKPVDWLVPRMPESSKPSKNRIWKMIGGRA
jgi:replicative DNA helicase